LVVVNDYKQQSMLEQACFKFRTWGGKRKGAGRPAKGPRSSEPHIARERFSRPTPVHVTLRVIAPIATLRRPDTYHAIRRAIYPTLEQDDFRIVHVSIEDNHLHLIVEADNHIALSTGIRAFESSAAQRLNRAISRSTGTKLAGKVFDDRYHSRPITSPTQARNTITYVLNNFRRHGRDCGMETMFWDVDYYSSGPSFDGWKELDDSPFLHQTPDYPRLSVSRPRTWLLAKGWRKAGPISMRDVPGPSE
jgi:REP element-mobilizing transposase RayT